MSCFFCSHFGMAVGVGWVVGGAVGAPGFFGLFFKTICPCNEALKASMYDSGSSFTGHEKEYNGEAQKKLPIISYM